MGTLYSGAAMCCVSPTAEMLAGINENGRGHFDGVGNDLMLRVVVLTDEMKSKTLLILQSDMSTFPMNGELVDRINDKFGIGAENILCCGTRSHNTVHIPAGALADMKPGFREYAQLIYDSVIGLISDAFSRAVPAEIGGAVGISGINVSREYPCAVGTIESQNHSAPTAYRLRVAVIRSMAGEIIAVLTSYSMHCCLLCWNDFAGDYKLIDGDVGGAVSRYVERAGAHKFPVLWAVGGGTDRQPTIYSRLERCEVSDEGRFYMTREILPAEGSLMLLRQYAAEQGQDILRTINKITNWSDEFDLYTGATTREVPERQDMMGQVKSQASGDYPANDVFYEPGMDMKPVSTGKKLALNMKLAVIGKVAFAGINASPYSKNYEALENIMPFDVMLLFDDCFGSVSSIPVPEAEEENLWAHSTLQNRCMTARQATDAFLGGFSELAGNYKLSLL